MFLDFPWKYALPAQIKVPSPSELPASKHWITNPNPSPSKDLFSSAEVKEITDKTMKAYLDRAEGAKKKEKEKAKKKSQKKAKKE